MLVKFQKPNQHIVKTEEKESEKIDSDGTDRPETSGRFTEAKRLSPA